MKAFPRLLQGLTAFGLLIALAACGQLPPLAQTTQTTDSPRHFSVHDLAQWEPVLLPGKLLTAFKLARHDQQMGLQADAQSSASMLRRHLRLAPEDLGALRFQWQVQSLIEGADMALREQDDAPVRVILAFEGDRSRFSARNAMLSELSRALTGEELPYATLMYVWCNHRPVGSVIVNPRTDRIRKLVVESGPQRLRQWLSYERDIRADFEKAFGEPPGALVGLAIMTDTDNTRSSTRAWYGPIALQ
jgi:hypothetical protein